MSFCYSGLDSQIIGLNTVTIEICSEHKIIKLANSIDWTDLTNLILPDLKQTTRKLKWWCGRRLKLRILLGAYLIQHLFDFTDRETENAIRENAAYMLFCGSQGVEKWHCPDHTRIEDFRSRLSPETQSNIANKIAILAVTLGFANPEKTDFDSTVQEANIAYPSDVNLLLQLGMKGYKIATFLNENIKNYCLNPILVQYKKMKATARKYFFLN